MAKNPDVIVKVKDKHLLQIARKKMNLQLAFVQGRLKLEGDSAVGMKLASVLSQLPAYED